MTGRDAHPIQAPPEGWPVEQRVRHLEEHLAQLWDQVWWLSLPTERRAEYEARGFAAPILDFYGEGSRWRP